MINKRIEDALNAQINGEFWSAYLYLSLSAHFAADGKAGFAHWFEAHAKEEYAHGMKMFNYIIQRGGKVDLRPIVKVPQSWVSPLAAFEAALKQEEAVSGLINNLVTLAREEKDYATENMLQWFVNEQVEEEALIAKYIDALRLIGDNNSGIYILDQKLMTER